jgi:hypothetical protein
MQPTNSFIRANSPCVIVEVPSWGDAEFYGRWLLAAAKAEAFWKAAFRDPIFQTQVERVCVVYIPDFGIAASLIVMNLKEYTTTFILDLDSEEGEHFTMMVQMGFFVCSDQRYVMTIPRCLSPFTVKQAVLRFVETEDEEYVLHPERLLMTMPFTKARVWHEQLRAMDRFRRMVGLA